MLLLQWPTASVLLSMISVCQAVLIVGPNTLRPSSNYTVVLNNIHQKQGKVDLLVRLDGQDGAGRTLLNLTKPAFLRRANKMITFEIPDNAAAGYYKLTINSLGGFVYNEEVELEYLPKSISGLIQLSKPVYKPGDSVQFRVIVLDPDLKPPSGLKMVIVSVQDSVGNNIRKWSDAQLYNGVFEGQLDIAPSPLLGTYNIKVEANNKPLVSKPFEVKEYVLSTFKMDVSPTVTPLEEHQALNLTIAANYYFGKPVIGTVKVQLYDGDNNLELSKTYDVNGMLQVHLPFTTELILFEKQQDFKVNVSFIEQYTNRTVSKEHHITMYKHKYQVTLGKHRPAFYPGSTFQYQLKIENHDGTPAKGVTVHVRIDGLQLAIGSEQSYTSDDTGTIDLPFDSAALTEPADIIVSLNQQEVLHETIERMEQRMDTYITVQSNSSDAGLNQKIKIDVTCSDHMTFLAYYVVSKRNIVDAGFIRLNKVPKHRFQLVASGKMVPRSQIIVVTVANNMIVHGYVNIEFEEFSNNFDLRMKQNEVSPGSQIELLVTGPQRAYVALASYDQSLLQHGREHDIAREDIWKFVDNFNTIESDDYETFHSMGLFVRSLEEFKVDRAQEKTGRQGVSGRGSTFPVSFRTNFLESWMWKNITIPRTGGSALIEKVPDTTTSWYLTGFSIDPVHGLGMMKKPIQFTTVQQFYIVDNLPYSIKRGEAVVLQFTLFNTLGAEYFADVTLHNMANQIEFVGQPAGEASYTKTYTVPPNVGIPVSFLVKARHLGEMLVRVETSIMQGLERDAIEKIIRVLPESLPKTKTTTRFFSHETYLNQSFLIDLDIDKNADPNSVKIDFFVIPNVLSKVVKNLGHLLNSPAGSGEQNMIHFVPNVIVLDYLKTIGSKHTSNMQKATRLLLRCYQRQLQFRQPDGSFGVWKDQGGSVFLTAFVAKSMKPAAKYLDEIDQEMVAKAFEWLSTKQQEDGSFIEIGSIFYSDMQSGSRQNIALTAYVLIAFLEKGNEAFERLTVIERGMHYIASHIENITDPYDLSIATYALWLNNHSHKNTALKRLIEKSVESNTKRYWPRDSNQIETTAYALLSFIEARRYADGIAIMRWLVDQQYATGSFAHTQDTFIGLQALTKLAEQISPSRNDFSIQLTHENTKTNFRVTSTDINKLHYSGIPSTVRQVAWDVGGLGFGIVQVTYEYRLDLKNFKNRFNLTVDKLNSTSDAILKLHICTSFLARKTDERSSMALVEVTFPSGYVTEDSLVVESPGINPIKKIEILYGATTAVLYYDNMGSEMNCFAVTAFRRFKVALQRPAYVKVHDFYKPNHNAIKVYGGNTQDICGICEGEECPLTC
ncbi:CD109 antigen-like isoform X3 [Anopheles darlingi]|uniref:CD109 antigen-like isoform X3 n=1 Tax=Anopheles darlingi TaxID=43151 RepID=UPI002100358D|nr:CD109 antigen-like isoform X3 [Anopheles darlingi]